jgi:hypothetical protein
MTKNTGKDFERLTLSIYRKLVFDQKHETVEHDVFLDGPEGPRQIDVLVTHKKGDLNLLTVIECKDYKEKVTIVTIDGFHSKLLDVKATNGIIVSRSGFTKNTFLKAKRLGITLCTAHMALSEKWQLDIDAPIRINEIVLKSILFNYTYTLLETTYIPDPPSLFANDLPLLDYFSQLWLENKLPFRLENGYQVLDLSNSHAFRNPFLLDHLNNRISLENLKALITVEKSYYETMLSFVEGIQKLNNLSENYSTVFVDLPTMEILKRNLTPIINVEEKKFIGLLFNITSNVPVTLEALHGSIHRI